MNAENWDEERIHAYVDGELDAFTAARLEAACRQDTGLNARVARQQRLRDQLRSSFEPVLDEAIPARLLESAKSPALATVTPIHSLRARTRVQPLWLGALAASLVIGLAIGWLAPREAALPFATGSNGLVATGHLDTALSQALSADGRTDTGVQLVMSFRASDGRYCRSFSLATGTNGLACQTGKAWRVEIIDQSSGAPDGQEYRQAGSGQSPAVLAAIGKLQSGDVLDAEQERQARSAGWRGSGGPAQ